MIHIGKPYTKTEGDRAYFCAPVEISPDTSERYMEVTGALKNCAWLTGEDYPPAAWKNGVPLWFSAPSEYEKYMCTERSNAFVIALLWYAMVTESDIHFETPMSSRLYDGLRGRLIPALMKDSKREIRLVGPVSDQPQWNEGGVVSGMSCGVDSLYTLACYGGEDAPAGMRLTHLVYYDGNYLFPFVKPPYDLDAIYEKAGAPHRCFADHAGTIATHHGLPLIYVQNNIDRDFYRGARIYSSMYRFLACTLALEHLYGTYISSSSGHEDNTEISLLVPTQHYEDLICESCRTETLHYVTSDHEIRSEKLRTLAEDEDAGKYTAVCYQPGENGENCGRCYACMKTIIPLDIMGKLDRFRACFDLDAYYSNRKNVYRELITFSFRPEASSARDSVRQFIRLSEQEKTEPGVAFLDEYNAILKEQER